MSTATAAGCDKTLDGDCGLLYNQDLGTSMAAPVVACIAALVRSANPGLSAMQAGQCITWTAGIGGVGSTSVPASTFSRTRDSRVHIAHPPHRDPTPIVNAAAAVDRAVGGGSDLPAPPGLPRPTARSRARAAGGVLWRQAGGADGTQRGQPYLLDGATTYTTLDPARMTCLAQRYVLRDFVPASTPLPGSTESVYQAPCPIGAPLLHRPMPRRTLRDAAGQAWFVDSASRLEPIPDARVHPLRPTLSRARRCAAERNRRVPAERLTTASARNQRESDDVRSARASECRDCLRRGTTDYSITLPHGCAYTLSAPLMADNANAAYSLTIVGDGVRRSTAAARASRSSPRMPQARRATLAHALGGSIQAFGALTVISCVISDKHSGGTVASAIEGFGSVTSRTTHSVGTHSRPMPRARRRQLAPRP